ncbi:MAG: FMN-binding glutamate synthase family protein [Alphaproteobacteria bacterium]|nr:FMN-binding glutamate synthase family protein [Alphaproteobacteria bacterium]
MSRYLIFLTVIVLTVASAGLWMVTPHALWALLPFGALSALGVWDVLQPSHSLLRNYPVVGHLRWLFEGIRPEIRQYLIESDRDEIPFSREQRSIVYQRAKDEEDRRPFGTRRDVYAAGYAWLTHSMAPEMHPATDLRVKVGGKGCAKPYNASVYNISAMSFGSLGANAIEALNRGAALGRFAHDTGEGGISRYHREPGGDLIWELGTGYFGCRDAAGRFDRARFADQAADDQVKMISVKLSQGAKPGHGGVLPGAKVTPEIAEARGVAVGEDCISPAAHSAFATPIEFMQFLQDLRERSGGKPVGFKLCVGHRWEFMALVKAMLETGIRPDFVIVDGKEGGTGAAPLEFSNHVGTPLAEGLTFVRNCLVGANLRDEVCIGASGKLVTAFDMVWAHALGADWCNSARGFMFALGCIQSQRCHTNCCPVGVATQDPLRQRALVVSEKAQRVATFHRNSCEALSEIVAAAGFRHPKDLQPHHLMVRQKTGEVLPADKAFPVLERGELTDGGAHHPDYKAAWAMARAESFAPAPAGT